MKRLRSGLVGAGLVGQAEHAFYLWEERERFDLVGVADASPRVRRAVSARHGVSAAAGLEELLALGLDVLVCAAPDPFHPSLVRAALDAGVHVLCEKPLALTERDCRELALAAREAGLVLQVAYMKRYDPSYRRLLELLPRQVEEIRLVSVEVNDPGPAPFVAHLPMVPADDLPAELHAEGARLARAQLEESSGRPLDVAGERALGGGFLSSLVHDVAVVHGLLAHLGHELPAAVDHGALFDEGRGVQLGFRLPGGGRVSMTHLNLPGVADYTERVTVYCADRILELVFPSPYLRHQPTRLTVRRTDGDLGLVTEEVRVGYEEAFREELRAFHAAVADGSPVETPAEQAALDVALLADAFRRAAA